jgi:PAS domain S-box-containing protein
VEEILAAAEERDSRAELRDRAAEERERATGLTSFRGDQQDGDGHQIEDLPDDGAVAARDRRAAQADRARAAMDRAELSALLFVDQGSGGSRGMWRMSEVAELSQQLRAPLRSIIESVEMLQVALRKSDERLRLLVEAVSDYAIIALDTDGFIESWNTGAERLKGYPPEEALGRHFSMFYTDEDRDTGLPQRLLDQARAQGSCENTGWRVRRDGSQFWADVVISAARDDAGDLTGFIKVTRDLTAQHRLEDAQGSFYKAFEHDFLVPITAIKGFAELIRDADPDALDDLAERVESNADRLRGMVEELIDYARLRSGLSPISLRNLDMTALAEVAVANLASIVDTSRVQVNANKPVTVIADPAALERVIANLVTNALKYSPAQSEITLTCEESEDTGVLRIMDHGRGIDQRDLSAIFGEFERGRLAQDDAGTGLGLASVQRLIGLQDGTVTITSEVGVGTTVTVELPLSP